MGDNLPNNINKILLVALVLCLQVTHGQNDSVNGSLNADDDRYLSYHPPLAGGSSNLSTSATVGIVFGALIGGILCLLLTYACIAFTVTGCSKLCSRGGGSANSHAIRVRGRDGRLGYAEHGGGDMIIVHDDQLCAQQPGVHPAPGIPGYVDYSTTAASPMPC